MEQRHSNKLSPSKHMLIVGGTFFFSVLCFIVLFKNSINTKHAPLKKNRTVLIWPLLMYKRKENETSCLLLLSVGFLLCEDHHTRHWTQGRLPWKMGQRLANFKPQASQLWSVTDCTSMHFPFWSHENISVIPFTDCLWCETFAWWVKNSSLHSPSLS